jgi:hypothetical protein
MSLIADKFWLLEFMKEKSKIPKYQRIKNHKLLLSIYPFLLFFMFINIIIAKLLNKQVLVYNNWQGCVRKGALIYCWCECKIVQQLAWRLLKKQKLYLTYDPAILLIGIYLKDCESVHNKGTCTLMHIAALFTIPKLWEKPRY